MILLLIWLQRNNRFFFMFISTSTILCIYVFVFSWVTIFDHHKNIWKAMKREILLDFLIAYCFIAVWFVGGLSIFHFYLICTNQVTFLPFEMFIKKKKLTEKYHCFPCFPMTRIHSSITLRFRDND